MSLAKWYVRVLFSTSFTDKRKVDLRLWLYENGTTFNPSYTQWMWLKWLRLKKKMVKNLTPLTLMINWLKSLKALWMEIMHWQSHAFTVQVRYKHFIKMIEFFLNSCFLLSAACTSQDSSLIWDVFTKTNLYHWLCVQHMP